MHEAASNDSHVHYSCINGRDAEVVVASACPFRREFHDCRRQFQVFLSYLKLPVDRRRQHLTQQTVTAAANVGTSQQSNDSQAHFIVNDGS